MAESSGFFKKAVGFDELSKELSEQKALFLARFDELDRQIKRLGDSVAYANHQLLEAREKLENVEISLQKLPSSVPKEHKEKKGLEFNEIELKVLDVAKKSGQISASEAALLSGLSRTRASEVLNELARKNAILKEKRGKTSFFIFNSDVSENSSGKRKETV